MASIKSLFVTRLYHAKLAETGPPVDAEELHASCFSIAEDDEAGQAWSEENGYPGYTSPTPPSPTCPGASRSSTRW
jgi:uncharacterized protein (TIGR02466 family)